MLLAGTDLELKDPTQTGTLDNMVSGNNRDIYGVYRMAAFFVARMSGNHIFTAACDYSCKVYFNHGPNISRKNCKISLATINSRNIFFHLFLPLKK